MPGLAGEVHAGVLLERADQLMALRRELGQVTRGAAGRVVLVQGEAGIGKTTLLREFCAGLAGSVRVLWAACDPLFTPRPLGPLLDLAGVTGGALAASTGAGAKAFDVATALLGELGSGGPVVVVLEDVHWADEATLDVIRLVGRRIAPVPAVLVVSYRDDELDRGHPLRVVLGDLAASAGIVRVQLAGISPAAVARLAEPHGIDPQQLYERTAGNPFFVTEVLAAPTRQIPRTVSDAVLARVARLSRPAREVLDAAAVVPGRVELWLLDKLVPAAADRLDECFGSGVLVARPDGSVAFRHEIARLVVEESMPASRRLALHRRVLTALTPVADRGGDLIRLMHHAEAAEDADAVLHVGPAAAAHAHASGSRREAASLYARALRFADRLTPQRRADLLERFAAVAYFTGQGEEAIAALTSALAIYRAGQDVRREADALRQLAKQLGLDGRLGEARSAARQAIALLERVPPGPELARSYATLSAACGLSDDTEAIRWGEKAISLAQDIGCADALSYALNNVGTVELRQGLATGLVKLERSRELAERAGDEVGVGRAYLHLSLVLLARREWSLSDRYLAEATSYCRAHGLETWLAWLTALTAEAELARGQWDGAVSAASSVLAASPERFSHARCTALVVLAKVGARRGTLGYWALLDEAARLASEVSIPQSVAQVAVARAEAAWLEGAAADRIGLETRRAWELERASVPWFAGELACWRWRAGLVAGDPATAAEPYRLEMTGDGIGAARWWQARGCEYEAALALIGSSEPAALHTALSTLRDLGARPAMAIVTKRLRALGVRGVPRGPRPRTSANPAGLTERQMQVLGLLAAGLSNAEIAASLVVSRRTIDHHVSAVLRKLRVPDRARASTEARRHGFC